MHIGKYDELYHSIFALNSNRSSGLDLQKGTVDPSFQNALGRLLCDFGLSIVTRKKTWVYLSL